MKLCIDSMLLSAAMTNATMLEDEIPCASGLVRGNGSAATHREPSQRQCLQRAPGCRRPPCPVAVYDEHECLTVRTQILRMICIAACLTRGFRPAVSCPCP